MNIVTMDAPFWLCPIECGEKNEILCSTPKESSCSPLSIEKKENIDVLENFRIIGTSLKARFRRAVKKAFYIFQGTGNGVYPLIPRYQGELLDRLHRYGKKTNLFFKVREKAATSLDFDSWLHRLDLGKDVPGKDLLKIENLLTEDGKKPIPMTFVRYLKEEDLDGYEMHIDQEGRISTKNNGYLPFHSKDSGKDNSIIFVVGPNGTLYIGPYERGGFSHSSFFAGKPVKSAGYFVFNHGKITEIIDDSGHYNSGASRKSDELMRIVLKALLSKGVDISGCKVTLTEEIGKEKKITVVSAESLL